MKKAIIFPFAFILFFSIVLADEVCIVADYGFEDGLQPDSTCVEIDEGLSGYDALEETSWQIGWSDNSSNGHKLCRINDIGSSPIGTNCDTSDKEWHVSISSGGNWETIPVGLDTSGGCWNRDFSSSTGHYCTKDGDVIAVALGEAGAKPDMFDINISKVYIDGVDERKARNGGGKIRNVKPGSVVEFNIELENLFSHSSDIEIEEVSIESFIEEIDDGSDLREDLPEFDLPPNRKDVLQLKYAIPIEIESEDRILEIEITGKDQADIRYKKLFNYDLQIAKDEHSVSYQSITLNKETFRCEESASLVVDIINTGTSSEAIDFFVTNDDLGINIQERFRLDAGAFSSAVKDTKRYNIQLPIAQAGTYPIEVQSTFSGNTIRQDIDLVISQCSKEAPEPQDTTTNQPATQKPAEPTPSTPVISTTPKETQPTITESSQDNTLLYILGGVLAVLIVAIIVTAIMVFSMRK